jgi:hypothetical protein
MEKYVMASHPLVERLEHRKKVIQECLLEFGLPLDTQYHEELLTLDRIPFKSSKNFAFLILTYKRECTIEILKKVSDQPAGIVRMLRSKGFVFKSDPNNPRVFQFRNVTGEVCREILYYASPKAQPRGRTKELIDKSVAACVSAIEVYNKPDFKYREESFAILMVNAWELLLKAKLLLDNKNSLRAIIATLPDGTAKRNRSGNLLTIDLQSAANRLYSHGVLDPRCRINIEALVEIRDNAIHFINTDISIQKKVMELGTASLQNYLSAMREWFNRDMAQYNFYLMPLSFFPEMSISDHIISEGSEFATFLKYIYDLERQFPSNAESNYNITLNYEVRIKKATDPDYNIFVTDANSEGMAVKVEEDDVYRRRYPLSYTKLIEKLIERYSDFKRDKRFYDLKKSLEDTSIHGEKYCRVRYLNSLENQGSKKTYYSPEILKEFDRHYTKR